MDAPDQHCNDGATAGDVSFARYRVPKDIAAIPGALIIKNDQGVAVFEIDGGAQITDDVIRVRDLAGKGACLIRGSTLPTDNAVEIVDPDAMTLATAERVKLTPVRDLFSVQVGSEASWAVEGLVTEHEYWIRDGTCEIAQVSRRWFRARETYGVQVPAGQNDLLVLTVAVCLDLMLHAGR